MADSRWFSHARTGACNVHACTIEWHIHSCESTAITGRCALGVHAVADAQLHLRLMSAKCDQCLGAVRPSTPVYLCLEAIWHVQEGCGWLRLPNEGRCRQQPTCRKCLAARKQRSAVLLLPRLLMLPACLGPDYLGTLPDAWRGPEGRSAADLPVCYLAGGHGAGSRGPGC